MISKLKSAPGAVRMLVYMVNDPGYSATYYPEGKPKSKFTIAFEMLMWVIRYREINKFYYVYGMDIKNIHRENEIIPYRVSAR